MLGVYVVLPRQLIEIIKHHVTLSVTLINVNMISNFYSSITRVCTLLARALSMLMLRKLFLQIFNSQLERGFESSRYTTVPYRLMQAHGDFAYHFKRNHNS